MVLQTDDYRKEQKVVRIGQGVRVRTCVLA